ncbi:MAG: tetratricopeptide repeat protein [Spirochaetia bacterium]
MSRTLVVFLVFLVGCVAAVSAQEANPDALEMYRSGDRDGAIRVTRSEIEANPNNIDSYVVLGWALNAAGRHAEAIDYGLQALQVNRFESRILQIVAEAHFDLGNTVDALEYLERYVQVAPTGSFVDWVYLAMGEILLQLGEFHRADIALTTSVYHNNRVASRWSRLGFAREQLGEWQYSLEAYERALQLDPNLGDAVRGRQRVQAQLEG